MIFNSLCRHRSDHGFLVLALDLSRTSRAKRWGREALPETVNTQSVAGMLGDSFSKLSMSSFLQKQYQQKNVSPNCFQKDSNVEIF